MFQSTSSGSSGRRISPSYFPEDCELLALQKSVWDVRGQLTDHYEILALIEDGDKTYEMVRASFAESGLTFEIVTK